MEAAKENLTEYSIQELSYLVLSMRGYFNESEINDVENFIKDRLAKNEDPIDFATQQRLAIAGLWKLDREEAVKYLQEIEDSSNIVELLVTDMLKDRKVAKNQLLCDDRLMCQILVDDKFVIEIQENMPVNFKR